MTPVFALMLILNALRCEGADQQRIRVRISRGDKTESVLINPRAKASELYGKAESLGIFNDRNNTVLMEYSGSIILDDPSTRLVDILVPPSLTNLMMLRPLILRVLAVKQIKITVHITNGDITESFKVNAATRTNEVYQKAEHIGLMENHFQFSLRYRYDPERVLMDDVNPATPQRRLLDCIDPKHPNELDLIVWPFPEGVLLYAMFREMAPNQDIPSWNYAVFCVRNPNHVLCSSLSRRIEYEDDMATVISKTSSNNDVEDWANSIYVVNVPTWSGVLHLENVPRSVRSMTLNGHCVKIDFAALRFTSLTELTLDFDEIIGFNIMALSGSLLNILRFPSTDGLPSGYIDDVIRTLNTLRAHNEICLERMVFGRKEKGQKVFWYNPEENDYEYIRVDSVRGSQNVYEQYPLASPKTSWSKDWTVLQVSNAKPAFVTSTAFP